jgi:MFS family permease
VADPIVSHPRPEPGLFAAGHRTLTVGIVLTVTLIAFESLAVSTVMPVVSRDLDGLSLYGWAFSAFFLTSLIGIVVAGREADRRGLEVSYVAGLSLFAVGLLVAGLAPAMAVVVAGRAIQGFGAGVIPATAVVTIGRGYPEAVRPRMFAVLSSAWIVPGLIGPGVSALVATHASWRLVFLGLLPLVAVAFVLTLPSLRRLPPPTPGPGSHRLRDALLVTCGAGLFLAGLGADRAPVVVVFATIGLAVAVPGLLALVPAGTFRARRGVPAAVLVRGLETFAYFGAAAYIPLALTSLRGTSTGFAGAALTGGALAWTGGSWIQQHRVHTTGVRPLVGAGLACVLVGVLTQIGMVTTDVPIAVAVAGWAVAGFGMGLSMAPQIVLVLREAPPGQEGRLSASLMLADVLGVAVGTGVGGALVAATEAPGGWSLRTWVALAFAVPAGVAALGIAVSRRLT